MAADATKIIRRLAELKTQRTTIEDVWRDCYRYTYPLRGVGLENKDSSGDASTNASTANSLQADLYDSTATDSVRVLASALLSGLTPANSRWFGLDVDGIDDGDKKWLDEAANVLWENIHQSNYDSVAFDCMLDVGISGLFAMFVDEAPGGGFAFQQWPLSSTYFASSRPGGLVDTVMNEYPLTAEQAIAEYGEDMVSDKIRDTVLTKPDEKFTFIRALYPRKEKAGRFGKNLPVASCHIEKDTKRVVRESGYHEMPVGVPRWSPVPGSAYAFGPVFDALPDIKTLNQEVKYVLQNADLAIAGMWIAEDDGVLNAKSIKIGARKVIVANSVDSMKALQPAGKFDVAALEIERLQRSIRKVLMADQLTPNNEGPAMTATEISVRVEMVRQILGPIYGRLQSEFLQWLVERCFGIAYRAGVFGRAPQGLEGMPLSVQYMSPIARAQKSVDVGAMDRYEQSLVGEATSTGKMELLDNYDWDEASRTRADLLGVPAKLIPDRDDVLAVRATRSQAQQQAKMQGLVEQAALQGAAPA